MGKRKIKTIGIVTFVVTLIITTFISFFYLPAPVELGVFVVILFLVTVHILVCRLHGAEKVVLSGAVNRPYRKTHIGCAVSKRTKLRYLGFHLLLRHIGAEYHKFVAAPSTDEICIVCGNKKLL